MHALAIRAFPRIHVGLIDLGAATERTFGGAGFTVQSPSIVIRISASPTFSIKGFETLGMDYFSEVERIVRRLGVRRGFTLKLVSTPPAHIGLGTKTAVSLSVIKLLDRAFKFDLTRAEMQQLSGRGGTSGVGINTFFHGGFIVDAGHSVLAKCSIVPSRLRRQFEVPMIMFHKPLPANWRIALILPCGKRLSGKEELEFFRNNAPVPVRDVHRTLAAVYHGLVPGIATADFYAFRKAIIQIQETGFKRREINNQCISVLDCLQVLNADHRFAAGMSSLGPLVYVVSANSSDSADETLRKLCAKTGCVVLSQTRPANRGHHLQRINT